MVRKHNTGFTLIELSIVLLVIAALVSVMLVGRAIVSRARLQAIVNDIEGIRRSFKMFTDNYGGMPGDLQSNVCNSYQELSTNSAAANLCGSFVSNAIVNTYTGTGTGSNLMNTKLGTSDGVKGDNLVQTSVESHLAAESLIAGKFLPRTNTATTGPVSNGTVINFTLASGSDSTISTSLQDFKSIKGSYFLIGGVSSDAANATSGAYSNVSGFGGLGVLENASWADDNFIAIVGSSIGQATATGGVLSFADAKSLKLKIDGTNSSPVDGGSIVFSGNGLVKYTGAAGGGSLTGVAAGTNCGMSTGTGDDGCVTVSSSSISWSTAGASSSKSVCCNIYANME